MAFFLVNDDSSLLNVLGVKYGYVGSQKGGEQHTVMVVTMAEVMEELARLLGSDDLVAEEAATLVDVAVKHGILPTFLDVLEVVKRFALPVGHQSRLAFVLHQCSAPPPHGSIFTTDGIELGGVITSVQEGLEICVGLEKIGVPSLDLANAAKQMSETDLSRDDEECRKRIAAILAEQESTTDKFSN